MRTQTPRTVIVGAGHGGANVAALLRQGGYDGEVVLIGSEPCAPYQRPPLSKDFLKGDLPAEHLLIKPGAFWAEQQIETRFGCTVDAVDPEARTVTCGEEVVRYDALVLATGSAPRRLRIPGHDLAGVHYLRSDTDALGMAAALVPGARVVIVGGGYVGLEVAASARHLGCEVTVLERESRALARVAGADLASFLVRYHADRGSLVRTGTDVVAFRGEEGRISAVELADGSRLPCDVVVVGVGATPCDDLAVSARLHCEDGVVVDEASRTSVSGVYAVGDLTRRPLAHFEGAFRLESIPSAVEQAKQVAADILGKTPPAAEVPWFWSDQFDLKIKIAGLVGAAEAAVVRGDPGDDKFSVFHLSAGRVVAVETVNAAADFMVGKKMVAARLSLDPAVLADPSVSLKAALSA